MPASAASPQFDQIFLPSGLGNETTKVETADLDQDGNEDLILLSAQSNQLAIFMGKGDGTFESVRYHTLRDRGSDFAIGDFDGDGKLDLAVANAIATSFSL
ncbi:FG-GAP repeat domain-containing protein [Brevibacillus panacihumi]|uniref:FG-GAP repeat domain-containing protein n=1 Tax=Brevibacillus panacihumi TaxID=497735 RepID=UPI003D248C9A